VFSSANNMLAAAPRLSVVRTLAPPRLSLFRFSLLLLLSTYLSCSVPCCSASVHPATASAAASKHYCCPSQEVVSAESPSHWSIVFSSILEPFQRASACQSAVVCDGAQLPQSRSAVGTTLSTLRDYSLCSALAWLRSLGAPSRSTSALELGEAHLGEKLDTLSKLVAALLAGSLLTSSPHQAATAGILNSSHSLSSPLGDLMDRSGSPLLRTPSALAASSSVRSPPTPSLCAGLSATECTWVNGENPIARGSAAVRRSERLGRVFGAPTPWWSALSSSSSNFVSPSLDPVNQLEELLRERDDYDEEAVRHGATDVYVASVSGSVSASIGGQQGHTSSKVNHQHNLENARLALCGRAGLTLPLDPLFDLSTRLSCRSTTSTSILP